MKKLQTDIVAPNFSHPDMNGEQVRLSDYKGRQNVLLVFNRGFF